ncbi:MAG TPA: oligosaccharide flippase family protein [Cytophagaceae bacterium]
MIHKVKKLFQNNNVLSLLGNGSAAALGFISFAILARSLTKEEFGSWVLFVTLVTFLDLLRTGMLHTPLIKFSAGKDKKYVQEVTGTAWVIGLAVSLSMSLISLLGLLIPEGFISNVGFQLFIDWIWIFSLATLPFNFATWKLQVESAFGKILFIRLILLGLFIALLVINYFNHYGLQFVLYSFLASNIITSVLCIVFNWTGIHQLPYYSKEKFQEIFNFGKFSMGTMIGANLLRSSDTLLIGALLGPVAVAIYSVPLKLFEIIEIPLRSFVATALPRLSYLVNSNDEKGLVSFFERTSGTTTILLLPFVVICFVFAEPMVVLLGGREYAEAANILRVFSIYAGFMAIDRYSGVTLDVINKPIRNFQKIMMMLAVNLSGDLLVIHFIGEVWSVAMVSIFTFVTGVLFGIYFLKRNIDFSLKRILKAGWEETKSLVFLAPSKGILK